MLQNLLSSLRVSTSNDSILSRRTHPRRGSDRCVVVIYGQTYPVVNWSLGGVLISADERLFGEGQEVPFTLKFRLRDVILDVDHRGHVVRKGSWSTAIRFEPLTLSIRRAFRQVVDEALASEFADSYVT